LLSTSELQVNIPWRGWVKFRVEFGEQYIPLVNELVEKALSKELSYTARIVFRNGRIYLHVSVPIELYLKYFRKGYARGELVAGLDLNSDRVNMVIVDRQGIIRDVKTEWYPEVTSHGFPRNKANVIRLQALAKLLDYAYYHNVGVVVFEDLHKIKKRKYTGSRKANRKIARKKTTGTRNSNGIKIWFQSIPRRDPSYTSKIGEILGKGLGLDRHTASAYVLTLKTLQPNVFKTLKSYYSF